MCVCVRYACQNFDRVDNAYVLTVKLRLAFGECVSMCIVKRKKSGRLTRMAGSVWCQVVFECMYLFCETFLLSAWINEIKKNI